MNARLKALLSLLAVSGLALTSLTSCSSGGGDSDSEETSKEGIASFTTDCGVPIGGILVNPVSSADGEAVTVQTVVDSSFVIVQREGGPQLVKLLGLSSIPAGGTYESTAKATLQSLAAEPAFLFVSEDGCSVTEPGGGVGIAGTLISASGQSYAEALLKAGAAGDVDTSGSCGSAAVAACFQGLKDTYAPKTAGEIHDFLWKPSAESAYNHGSLVIHAGPCDATVKVNGEALLDFGPGNGRCNTSRAFQPGCAYGKNVKVEIIDNATGLPYTHNGVPYVTVPDGCSRFEFKN